jgi:hypothetical protein
MMPLVPLSPRIINEITQNDFERNKEILKGIQCYLTGTIILRRIEGTESNFDINNGMILSYNQSNMQSIRIRNNTKCQIIAIEKYYYDDNYDNRYNYDEYNYNSYYDDSNRNDKEILHLRVSFDWDDEQTLDFAAVYEIQNDTFKLLIPQMSVSDYATATNTAGGTREQERGRIKYGEDEYMVFFSGAAPYLSVDYRHNVLPRSEIYDAPGRDLGRR